MANEARVHAEGANDKDIVRYFTVVAGTNITQGSLLVANGLDRGARLHVGKEVIPLGFAVNTIDSTDTTTTRIGLQRTGVVDLFIDGTVNTGDLVIASPTTGNRGRAMDVGTGAATTTVSYQSWNAIIGRALENGTNGQQIKVALTLG